MTDSKMTENRSSSDKTDKEQIDALKQDSNINNMNEEKNIEKQESDVKPTERERKQLKGNKIEKEQSKDDLSTKILKDLYKKKVDLEKEIKNLEYKKGKLTKEIGETFNGQTEDIAKQVKGFQVYLTGALQNLSQSVEKLELVSQPIIVKPSPLDGKETLSNEPEQINVPALADTFKPDEEIIRKCFASFIEQPDFYAEPWKLRRSLDSSDIEILEDWFFNMGGRGALESKGSRQKNVLVTAGLISILGELYGDQFQTLILASQPERLGEWRRILQDSLGLTREDFGPNSGIMLFERAEGVIERADRLEENDEIPLIIVDASERSLDIPIIQFPLWLAFAGTDNELYNDLEMY